MNVSRPGDGQEEKAAQAIAEDRAIRSGGSCFLHKAFFGPHRLLSAEWQVMLFRSHGMEHLKLPDSKSRWTWMSHSS